MQSKGSRLPGNWRKYTNGGDLSLMCLFCQERHDGIEVLVYPTIHNSIEGADACGAYMCDSCFIPVKAMESDRAAYRGDAGIFNSKELENRIHMFVEEFTFKPEVAFHYVHLDENWPYENRSNKCYFCTNFIDGNARLITVPVSPTTVPTGGKIKVCPTCFDLIRLSAPEVSLAALSENHGNKTTICPGCDDNYLITTGEEEDRIYSGTVGKHYCPACVYKNIDNLKPLLLNQPTVYSEDGGMNRFIYSECGYCGEDLDIDITLTKSWIDKVYVSFSGKLMCDACSQGTAGPIGIIPFNNYYWQIYATSIENTYRVIVRTSLGKILLDELRMGNISTIILNYFKDVEDLPSRKHITF